jgi:hypothetical protein
LSLIESLFTLLMLAVFVTPAIRLLVASRHELAAGWNETAARYVALEALEWCSAVPRLQGRQPLLLQEPALGSVQAESCSEGVQEGKARFQLVRYDYPAGYEQFSRRLEVTELAGSDRGQLLCATVTVEWTEHLEGRDCLRKVQLWRVIGR